MKKFLVSWLILALLTRLGAAPITGEQAQQVAQTFLQEHQSAAAVSTEGPSTGGWAVSALVAKDQTTVGYLAASGTAYAVVRADTDCPPIKFFAETGTYQGLPPAFREILEAELAAELAYVRSDEFAAIPATSDFSSEWYRLLGYSSVASTAPAVTAAGTKVLSTAAWDQGVPYNLYCPTAAGGPGGRAWAGCTATATSIILRYHQWPDAVAMDYSYGSYKVSDVGLAPYDWANMPTSDLAAGSTATQQQAVARLLYHCAILCDSDFGASGTGAWLEESTLRTYLKYSCANLKARDDYTLGQWMAFVRADIDSDRPIFWAMWSATTGHAIVCDGYDGDYTVHLNLGWGGYATGWYDLRTAVVAGGESFLASSHMAIFEIEPSGLPTSAPTITTHPSSQTALTGGSVSFAVAASGYPSPTYQWQKNGSDILGATGAAYTIVGVAATDAGDYRAVATNSAGSATSNAATLTVHTPASIVVPPVALTLDAGSTATFSVVVAGEEPITYQWALNGNNIPGANSATYSTTVSDVTAGSYRITVSNAYGSDSATTSLTVIQPPALPAFTSQPSNQTIDAGDSVVFAVTVSGYPPPVITWQKDGVDIPNSTGSTLRLTNVQPEEAGNYRAVATNSVGTATSVAAVLTVNTRAPVITTQPEPALCTVGGAFSFSVAATGLPPPTFQWQKDGADIVGANSSTYSKRISTFADAGLYTVVVSNYAGSVTSLGAILTVNPAPSAPRIIKQPTDQTVIFGSPVSFAVESTGFPVPTFQWYKDGTAIVGATAQTLSIAAANYGDAGGYSVVASNVHGSKPSITAKLTVNAPPSPPSITTQPVDQTVGLGMKVSFTVVASGNPAPSYSWKRNGVALSGGAKATFTISSVQKSDAGSYSVEVSNSEGTVTSNTATLAVNYAPSIVRQPEPQAANQGEAVSFVVEADGYPAPTYQWYRAGVAIPGATSAAYGIPGAQPADAGNYKVVVSNPSGSVTSDSVALTISTAPRIANEPADLSVLAGESADFSVVANGSAPITYQWYLNGVLAIGHTQATFGAFATAAYHDGCTFRCVVTNAVGSTTTRDATLHIGVPSAPSITGQPTDMTGTVGTSADFFVEATGLPAPTYQWYRNGAPVPGATSPSFGAFSIEGYHDGWSFHCVVANASGSVTSRVATVHVAASVPPQIDAQPEAVGAIEGEAASLAVSLTGATSVQWFHNGQPLDSNGPVLTLPTVQSADAGLYDCLATGPGGDTLSDPIIVGVAPAQGERTAGAVVTHDEWQNISNPNGAVYDQFLLVGNAGTITADPNQIARMSFLDPRGSIVQVEMSGAGAITVVLDPATASGPKAPALYNQSGIEYMQGKATVVLSGADETTHFTIYSVGTATNPGVTLPDMVYPGWADVAAAGIISSDRKLGGIHQGNVAYNATAGQTGIYAPSVASVSSVVVVHNITAADFAQPYLFFAPDGEVGVKIAGGALAQPNGDALTVSGLASVTLGAGQDSCGNVAPPQQIGTTLIEPDGTDVTALLVGP